MWPHASPMPAAEVGDGKGSRSGSAPRTLTGPTGELFIATLPLALLVDTCVRYQGGKKKKKKDRFGTFLKKIKKKFFKRGE